MNQAAGMSADNVEILSQTEYLAEEQSFKGKCKILRKISELRTLSVDISADISAIQEGFDYFITIPLIFVWCTECKFW